MPLQQMGDVRLEKSIVIPYEKALEMEAAGVVLPSDGYTERTEGERAVPSLIKMQETVDYETAMRLAAAKGVSIPFGESVMPQQPEVIPGKNMATSKLPSAIKESFMHHPPAAPSMPKTEFNPEFLSKVKEHNSRMSAVLGETSASRRPVNEPAPQPRSVQQPSYTPSYVPSAPAAAIDYPFLSSIMKEAVREVLQEVNLKELVKEVLKEEHDKMTATTVNENVKIILGKTVLSGHVQMMQQPKK